jgi:hypothetical protein
MPDDFFEDGKWKFAFIPEFADCIARIASLWARLEYDVNASIWALAELRPALGACITAQIYTLQGHLSALLALAKLREVDAILIKRINKFADDVRVGQDIRNRVIHDLWLNDRGTPGNMGHLRITADKTLKFVIESVPLFELTAQVEKVEALVTVFASIRKAIEAALPSLPEIPQTKLHPITETR